MTQRPLKIFISSPSDVRPERLIAERVVQRLAREFAYHFRLEPVLWEREPLIATEHFQTMIRPPSDTDIVLVILWSKLGTPLPAEKFRRLDGSAGVTGTEWEFEDAVRGYRERGTPDLLVYRKRTRIQTFLDDEAVLENQREQKRTLEAFWRRWFEDHEQGGVKAAWHGFDAAEEFEAQLETHLRALLEARVREQSGGSLAPEEGGGIHWFKGSPFRGLQSFELEHAAVFFGRTRARNRLRELIQARDAARQGFLLVFGASGSGKSSLMKAGLLPDLLLPGMVGRVALVRHALWTPSQGQARLAEALLRALPELEPLGWTAQSLAPVLLASPETALVPIRQALANAGKAAQLTEHAEARLLLMVDQLEELFTGSDVAPDAFARLAQALAQSGIAWVIATMRSDFFDRLATAPLLAELAAGEGQYQLLAVEAGEIAEIVRRPAREAGLRFETNPETGVALDSELIAAASADRAALPLLEFTLDELWQRRTGDGALTFQAYAALGGLAGALAHRAEEVFRAEPAPVQGELPALARALVSMGEDGIATARAARTSELARARALADALTAARLLTADAGTVRIAHEALIRHWPRLARQIEEDRADLAARGRIEQAARRHAAQPDPSLLLPGGLPLSEAEDLLGRRRAELAPELVDFIERSAAAHRLAQSRGRRRLQAAAVIFAVLAAAAGIGAVVAVDKAGEAERERAAAVASAAEAARQREAAIASAAAAERERANAEANAREAARQRDVAEAERARVLAQQSLYLVRTAEKVTSEPGMPFLLLREALPKDLAKPDRPFVPEAFAALYAVLQKFEQPVVFQGERERIVTMALSGDGRRLLAAGRRGARLYDVEARRPLATFAADSEAAAVAIAADGREVALAAPDGTVRLFGIDGKPQGEIALGEPVVQLLRTADRLLAVTRGGKVLALANGGATEIASGARSLAVAGNDLLIGGTDGVVRPAGIAAHDGPVTVLAASPDGRLVATAAANAGLVRLWRDGRPAGSLYTPRVAVRSAAFSPDGKRLLTGHDDAQARLWSVDDALLLASYREDGVGPAVLTADGRQVITGNDFGLIKVWDGFADAAAIQTRLDMGGLIALLIAKNITPEQRRAMLLPEIAAAPAVEGDPCDRLAAHPYDPARKGRGVFTDQIDPRLAVPACERVAQGGEARSLFQLGRALTRAGQNEAAERAFRAAAERGHGLAMTTLARLKVEGAAEWLAKAVASRDPLALYDAGDLAGALREGLPLAAIKLGEQAESGGDVRSAVKHYALAFRLQRDAGLSGEGLAAGDRASTQLRRLAPADLARLYREVEDWKP